MRDWWFNQNQTYRHKVADGYLWSPKRNANKARSPFYESMREVAPGDIIFSFLLTPTIDHLFDKEFISFEDKGDLIVSPVADRPSLLKMGIKPEAKLNVGAFSEGQRVFLEYHRENVLRMSRRS